MDPPEYLGCGTFGKPVVNTTEVLESVLILAPTTLEMGLTPLQLLHLDSQASSQQEIADLVAARDASDRYSAIQIMSSDPDRRKTLLKEMSQLLAEAQRISG